MIGSFLIGVTLFNILVMFRHVKIMFMFSIYISSVDSLSRFIRKCDINFDPF